MSISCTATSSEVTVTLAILTGIVTLAPLRVTLSVPSLTPVITFPVIARTLDSPESDRNDIRGVTSTSTEFGRLSPPNTAPAMRWAVWWRGLQSVWGICRMVIACSRFDRGDRSSQILTDFGNQTRKARLVVRFLNWTWTVTLASPRNWSFDTRTLQVVESDTTSACFELSKEHVTFDEASPITPLPYCESSAKAVMAISAAGCDEFSTAMFATSLRLA